MSRRMEKQNVAGTGTPDGLSRMQCEYTDCVVFSNACVAKFSQYSTTDWFSNSWMPTQSVRERGIFFSVSFRARHRRSKDDGRHTSQMYLPFPRSSSFVQSVSMQNSGPTRQISPVRLHTTVGVPLYEISLSSSCSCWRRQSTSAGVTERGKRRTMMERWKHFSTNTSSSSVSGICSAMSDGRKMASARTIRSISFFSNLVGREGGHGSDNDQTVYQDTEGRGGGRWREVPDANERGGG